MRSTAAFTILLTALTFLQGVPAPPAVLGWVGGIAAVGIAGGGTAAILAVGITEAEKQKIEEAKSNRGQSKRHQHAVAYAHRMVREIATEIRKRQVPPQEGPGLAPPGVPQYNWDDCYDKARQASLSIIGPVGDSGIRATGLPPVCMNLATLLGGTINGTGMPIPCGSDCMDWVGMTQEYYEGLRRMLNSQAPVSKKTP